MTSEMYLTFYSRNKLFAIDVGAIGEILPLRDTVDLPKRSRIMKAGVNVRGQTLPLFDFRALFDEPGLFEERQELVSTLTQREQEHIEWLDALTKSVHEGCEFRKALNPRACAFGKWFYSYKAPDSTIERVVAQFEAPHAEIHALAEVVLAKARSGDKKEAMQMIEHAQRTTLSRLLRLFAELRTVLVTDLRNLFIILETPSGFSYALCVDGVESVGPLNREKMNYRADSGLHRIVKAVWSNETQTICEVDIEFLHSIVAEDQNTQAAQLHGAANSPTPR